LTHAGIDALSGNSSMAPRDDGFEQAELVAMAEAKINENSLL
jgi:hypothetical protein